MPSTHMIHFLHLLIMSWWVALFLILYKYIVTYIMEGDFLCFFFSISFSFFMELTFFFLSLISITTGSENFKFTRKFHCRYTLLVAKYSIYKLFIVCTLFLNESLHTFKAWIESPGIKCHQYQRSSFWNTIHSLCALYCSYLWYKKKKKKSHTEVTLLWIMNFGTLWVESVLSSYFVDIYYIGEKLLFSICRTSWNLLRVCVKVGIE